MGSKNDYNTPKIKLQEVLQLYFMYALSDGMRYRFGGFFSQVIYGRHYAIPIFKWQKVCYILHK
jgi:hypothetical protein